MPSFPIVDAHVHFWEPQRLRYPWLQAVPELAGAHLPAQVLAASARQALEALVFVQCDCAPEQELEEVEWVADLARSNPRIRAIVAGLRAEDPQQSAVQLAHYRRQPLVRGVRRLIQDEPDPKFCLSPDFVQSVRQLAPLNYTFDLCARAHQLPALTQLVAQVENVQFVLDHLGKPDVRRKALASWQRDLSELARAPNVVCKISGLVTEAHHRQWTAADLLPYLEHALDAFGAQRLLYGSDWPVQRLASTYQRWIDVLEEFLEPRLSAAEQSAFWCANARAIYRLQ